MSGATQTRSFRFRSFASRAWLRPTSHRSLPWRASTRCSSSSPSTCRTCSTFRRLGPARAYIPVTVGVAISAGVCSKLFVRTGTRPIMVAGALLAAGGVYWLSRIPVHGSYLTDLLPGLMIMSIGLGAVFVGVQTAANAGVPPDKAGLAAALINASFQLGAALGLAIFSAVATSRTNHLLADHIALPEALTSGFHLALLVSSLFLVAAALIALRATNTRGEPISSVEPELVSEVNPVPVVEVV